jgi:hypothetical protein
MARLGKHNIGPVAVVAILALVVSQGAVADASGATVPPSITGTVTASDGTPLAGICVSASWPGGGLGNLTTSNGTYTLPGSTVDETAEVRFTAGALCQDDDVSAANYASQFYDDTEDGAAATPVVVVAGQTASGVDAVMAVGGSITGTVTAAADGSPVFGACVQVQSADGQWGTQVNTALNGTYDVDGLGTGNYVVAFYSSPSACKGSNPSFYDTQWYDGATSLSGATLVSVTAGDVTGGIDAAVAAQPQTTPTTTLIQGSSITSTSGQSVTFTASVSGTGGTPTGDVVFSVGATSLCTATLTDGAGSCVTNDAPVGPDGVMGTYSGDGTFVGSEGQTSLWVSGPAPVDTTTTVAASPSSSVAGQNITFSAVATATPTLAGTGRWPGGDVTFSVGSTVLCTAQILGGSGGCTADTAPVGDDTVVGTYSGDGDFLGSTGTASLDVAPVPVTGSGSGASSGYDLVGQDGGVFVFPTGHSGGFYGSLPGVGVHVADITGMVSSPDQKGYFLIGRDGGVFAFGDAPFLGSLPGLHVSVSDIRGIVPTADNRGYFLVGADGGVFTFGDAAFLGSLPGRGVHVGNIIGIAATPSDQGYWLVAANGTVYAFGNAEALGSALGTPSPVASITATPDGGGYWIVTQAGGVYPFGDARSLGSLPALDVRPARAVIGLVPTVDDGGYWLIGSDGGIFAFGDAPFVGSLPALGVHITDVVGAVPTAL